MKFCPNVPEKYLMGEKRYVNFKEAARIIGKDNLSRNKLLAVLRKIEWLDQYNYCTDNELALLFIKNVENRHLTPLISIQGIDYLLDNII